MQIDLDSIAFCHLLETYCLACSAASLGGLLEVLEGFGVSINQSINFIIYTRGTNSYKTDLHRGRVVKYTNNNISNKIIIL